MPCVPVYLTNCTHAGSSRMNELAHSYFEGPNLDKDLEELTKS